MSAINAAIGFVREADHIMIEKLKSQLQQELEAALKTRHGCEATVIVEEPKRANQGDISVPVFSLAKPLNLAIPETVSTMIKLIKIGRAHV